MGIIIDKDLYEIATAHGYRFTIDGKTVEMLWSPGVIGALSPQQREYKKAQGKVVWEAATPQELKERIRKFQEGADEAERRYEEEGRPGIKRWLELLKEEVEIKRGIPLGKKEEHLKE